MAQDLESAVSDTGKAMLREHLLLVADCLSVTGEFVALNPKGWSKQRQAEPTPAPFTQACFSVLCNLNLTNVSFFFLFSGFEIAFFKYLQSPSQCFLKAAKEGVTDELQGSIDALAWGKVPSFGTGDQFEIIISPKVTTTSFTLCLITSSCNGSYLFSVSICFIRIMGLVAHR